MDVETVEEIAPPDAAEIAKQKKLLEDAIELASGWFETDGSAEVFDTLEGKARTLALLLDPLIWTMREALITYEERETGCEECTARIDRWGNNFALTIAVRFLA